MRNRMPCRGIERRRVCIGARKPRWREKYAPARRGLCIGRTISCTPVQRGNNIGPQLPMDTPVSHPDRRPSPALLTVLVCAASLAAAAPAHARDGAPDADLAAPDAAGTAPALVP